ncbi:glycoside hydrolase family 3 protein [Actinokineospora sp. UTMC 2448]|uniref:glycoside hydrolase family 3 protein n=1 Tax=Actinokineospora sp. UTMC 2448 TaxID=2268449 RepID=UPI0022050515|nr:Beta-hexosaminidase A precursor [Actinokineospora sp. UTMC 2448]
MPSSRTALAAAVTLTAAAIGAVTIAPQPTSAANWVDAALDRLSLEQKVGQLFVATVWGKSATEAHPNNQARYGVATPAEVVSRYQLGGVIYFNNSSTDNVDNPAQLAAFSNGLQRAALGSAPHIPLVIAIDQEGGNVTRVESPATEYPSAMALGAGRSQEDARTAAVINGRELRAMGVNQNFAPVADVNSNPLNPVIGARSFAADPELAAQMVAAQVRGYQDGGRRTETVSSSAKHFPGHGDAATDSHTGLPRIDRSAEDWRAVDLPPFKAAVDAGIDSIMTAHIQFPSLDPSGVPATLSRPILTGLLRDELGYDGLIVTDALGMQGVREMFGDAEVPVLALEAGVDQLLMPPDLPLARDAVLAAVRSGRISEARIDESVRRILKQKWERGIITRPLVDVRRIGDHVGTPQNLAAVQALTDRTVTLLRNDADALPLSGNVLVAGVGDTVNPTRSPQALAAALGGTAMPTGTRPSETVIAQAEAAARDADAVVVLTNNLSVFTQQRTLLTRLIATGTPVVAVASQVPYDAGFVDAPTWLATYSWRGVSMKSLAKVLTGEVSPSGKLPVAVPDGADPTVIRYPYGHGLGR